MDDKVLWHHNGTKSLSMLLLQLAYKSTYVKGGMSRTLRLRTKDITSCVRPRV